MAAKTALLLLHDHTPARYTYLPRHPTMAQRGVNLSRNENEKVRKPLPTRTSPSHRGGSRSRCTNMEAGQHAGLLLLLLLLAGATAQVPFLACVRAQKGPVTG